MGELMWLIWSREQGQFWQQTRLGYTRHVEQAGRFTLEDALASLKKANRVRPEEFLYPAPPED
jgi:hypothetical protein